MKKEHMLGLIAAMSMMPAGPTFEVDASGQRRGYTITRKKKRNPRRRTADSLDKKLPHKDRNKKGRP